jgi:hypothetical protein
MGAHPCTWSPPSRMKVDENLRAGGTPSQTRGAPAGYDGRLTASTESRAIGVPAVGSTKDADRAPEIRPTATDEYSDVALAALTTAVSPIATRRRTGWSSRTRPRGVVASRPINSTPSSPGNSHLGPTVKLGERPTWSRIAASTHRCAGQKIATLASSASTLILPFRNGLVTHRVPSGSFPQ